MNPEMREQLDAMMGGWALKTGSASHPADREKLRSFFLRWYRQGEVLAVADWEQNLLERGWSRDKIREVVELPEDVAIVARELGH
jgi:hypothetical protein